MGLLDCQTQIQLGRLYKTKMDYRAAEDQLRESLFVNSGSVNVYVYNGATQPTALSNMVLTADNTAISGISSFDVIPSYIAFVQNAGTTTELVLTGVTAVDLGSIS